MKRLLVGLFNGLIAGAVAAVVLNQSKREPRTTTAAGGDLSTPADRIARARALFEQGRQRAKTARSVIPTAQPAPAATGAPGSQAVAPAPSSPIAVWRDELRTRWQEAVSAGKEASAEKQSELRRKYLEQTGRLGGR